MGAVPTDRRLVETCSNLGIATQIAMDSRDDEEQRRDAIARSMIYAASMETITLMLGEELFGGIAS